MVSLRDVIESDLPFFFEYQRDDLAVQMTSFPPREKEAFDAHWVKIMANEAIMIKTILFEGQVAGSILSFEMEGEREVGYWLGREFWGKGIASEALRQFLSQVVMRPLFARVAQQNTASKRVLEKCGFVVVGEEKWTPPTGSEEVMEYVLRLI
jgi:RimJ/RimL family protein N-acetyltransferase